MKPEYYITEMIDMISVADLLLEAKRLDLDKESL